jgi:hypothetical protein
MVLSSPAELPVLRKVLILGGKVKDSEKRPVEGAGARKSERWVEAHQSALDNMVIRGNILVRLTFILSYRGFHGKRQARHHHFQSS